MPYLLWIDCEMTGLDSTKDVLLELACIVTDMNLEEVGIREEWVFYQDPLTLNRMSPLVARLHKDSGLTARVRESNTTYNQVEACLSQKLLPYAHPGPLYLAGNSIYCDRRFIEKFLPGIMHLLHYRMVDVSSFKILLQSWYAKNQHAYFVKKESHRALQDISESIAEMKHYKKYFFTHLGN